MDGFHNLVSASMVLKSVDTLSDEGAPEETPVPKSKPNKGKSTQEPKKRPAAKETSAEEPSSKKPTPEPSASASASAPPEVEEKPKRKGVLRKPAAAGPKIGVSFYKEHGRFGFKIDGKEKIYVTRLKP